MHQQFIGGIKNGELFYYNAYQSRKFLEIDYLGGRVLPCPHLFESTIKIVPWVIQVDNTGELRRPA